ncbi:MAG: hypothetical protein Q9M22_03580 [Mariprofundaceae bacterium]|nr:hypothetical protein [Mariprofundaceae bacterium]
MMAGIVILIKWGYAMTDRVLWLLMVIGHSITHKGLPMSKRLFLLILPLLLITLTPSVLEAQDISLKDKVSIKEIYYKASKHTDFDSELFIRYTTEQGLCVHWGGGMAQPLEKTRVDIMRKRSKLDWEASDIYIVGQVHFGLDSNKQKNCDAKEELKSMGNVSWRSSSKEWKPQWLIQTRLHLTAYSISTKERFSDNKVFFTSLPSTTTKEEWVAERNIMLMERMEDMEKFGCYQEYDGSLKCIKNVAPFVPGAQKMDEN